MLHVFPVFPPEFSRNFSKSQSKIFSSPKAFTQGESYKGRLAPCFARCFALLSSRAYVGTGGEAQYFSKFQSLYGESSEFFQVPGPSYRMKGMTTRTSLRLVLRSFNSQSHIFLHIFHIFLHVFTYFHIFPTSGYY